MKYLILCYFVFLSYSISATMQLSVGVRNEQQNLLCIKEDLRSGNTNCCQSPDYCTVRTNQACCDAGLRGIQKACNWIPGGAIQCYAVGTICTVTDSNKNKGNCVLAKRSYGDKRPVTAQCNSNYTGTCSYTCNNGAISGSGNCKRKCSGTPDALKCPSVTNITHNQANVTRLCKSGYTGTCSYTCNNGTLGGLSAGCTQVTDRPCLAKTYLSTEVKTWFSSYVNGLNESNKNKNNWTIGSCSLSQTTHNNRTSCNVSRRGTPSRPTVWWRGDSFTTRVKFRCNNGSFERIDRSCPTYRYRVRNGVGSLAGVTFAETVFYNKPHGTYIYEDGYSNCISMTGICNDGTWNASHGRSSPGNGCYSEGM